MADAATIGANFSDYIGNAGLGEVGLGVFNIDTKPLQQLASYTFFYNKAVFDQKQKDAEAAAKEISDYTSIDLTSGIAKDAKLLQSKWDKLNAFVRDHPESLNYKDREAWTEYKKLRGDLANDITGAGVRDKLNMVRQKEIQDATTVAEKERLQKDLDAEIERTDIRTPIKYTNKFDIEQVKYAAPKILKFTVTKEYPNYITGTDVSTTDMADVVGQANAAITGLSKFMNPQTDLEKQQYASQKNTGKLEPILSAQNLSAVIPQFVKDGKFDYEAAKKSGNSILAGNASNVQAYNRKMEDMTNAIKSGVFKDKLSGGVAAFGVNGINENDYQKIDLDKGYITPLEYAKLNIMGLAEPMVTSKTEIKPTGEANDLLKSNIAASTQRRGQDLDFQSKQLDLIGKGWMRDKKGKLQPPKNNASTSAANGGIVPYWQNYITPQINAGVKKISNVLGLSDKAFKNFSGDVDIKPNDVSGLGIALVGEVGAAGHQKGIIGADITTEDAQGNEKTVKQSEIKIRFENGNPIGVVIDGIFYDQNDINSKATRLQDKTVSNKQDASIFGTTEQPETQLTDAQKFLQGIK